MKHILFFTPILPCHTGNGSAIRAGIALQLLSERHHVTVIQLDLWQTYGIMDESLVRAHAQARHVIPGPTPPDAAQKLFADHLVRLDVAGIYVFRLAAATFALQVMALLPQSPLPNALDVDDDECARTEKFIPLREAAGEQTTADTERSRLLHLRGLQRLLLSRFDVCLLASNQERNALAARYPGNRFGLLPNVVRLPSPPTQRHDPSGNLLFLGSLSYLPNEDAVLYFCNSILPLLQDSSGSVPLRIVGTQVPASLHRWQGVSGVTVVGPVKDIASEYARAGILVVPLRAGSGTRIKILEAFSYGVPVVSTTAGAEGLDVSNNVHLLIADAPEEFAACCRRLLADPALASRLATNALEWLKQSHTPDAVRPVFNSLFQ